MKILFLLLVLIVAKVEAQSLKDFYIPKNPYNKATYILPNQPNRSDKTSRVIYFVRKEKAFEITEKQLSNGIVGSMLTMTVEFSNNELKMINSLVTNVLVQVRKSIMILQQSY